MTELRHLAPAAALPLALLAGSCGDRAAAPANQVNTVQSLPKAEPSPAERAQQLVRERLGAAAVTFEAPQTFTNGGATVICGRYQLPGQPPQRYIAVGEQDVFVEGDWNGDMNAAVAETCRNG